MTKIPEELRKLDQWVLWKAIGQDKRKTPFQVSGDFAKANDPSTWTSYDRVVAASSGYSGIGFEFSKDDCYCGIDFDGCRSADGVNADWATKWIKQLNSYTELSPSGTGFKVFVCGKSPFDRGKKKDLDVAAVCDKLPGIEIYDHNRYFAVTGQRLAGFDSIRDVSSELLQSMWDDLPAKRSATSGPVDVSERAARYVDKMPLAVAGQSGHNATFKVACVLVLGFLMSPEEAFPILKEYSEKCNPPWSDRELWHKLNDANRQCGERGYLRDAKDDQWQSIAIPKYELPKTSTSVVAKQLKFVDLKEATLEYINTLDQEQSLIETGIGDLDYALGGGVERGESIIVAGRPSHGKTAIALQLVHQMTEAGYRALFVSEEMPAKQLGKRTLQFSSSVSQEAWRFNAAKILQDVDTHFATRKQTMIIESCVDVDTVCKAVESQSQSDGIDVVVVDYVQRLKAPGKSRYEQTTNASIQLKQLAMENKLVLVLLCQLNRSIESRVKGSDVPIPQLSDLRESGQLEQDADVVLFVVWPHRLSPQIAAKTYLMHVAKNRNRPINTPVVKLEFLPSRQKIDSESVASMAADNRVAAFDNFNDDS